MFCKEKNKTARYILIALLVISVILNIWLAYQLYKAGILPPANHFS